MEGTVSARRPVDTELLRLAAKTKTLMRGSLVRHAEIERWTGVRKNEPPWKRLIWLWKSWAIRERNISIVSEPGIGYRLATVDQQLDFAVRLEKAGGRRLERAIIAAGVIPENLLSAEGKVFRLAFVGGINRVQVVRLEAEAERKLSPPTDLPRLGVW
jgi:hypothetical protein